MDPVAAPRTEHELLARARALEGRTLGDIAADLSASVPDDPVHAKGKLGTLVERALGADGQPGKAHDFTALRVELKTVPVSAEGHPVESTYVCTLSLTDADARPAVTAAVSGVTIRVSTVQPPQKDAYCSGGSWPQPRPPASSAATDGLCSSSSVIQPPGSDRKRRPNSAAARVANSRGSRDRRIAVAQLPRRGIIAVRPLCHA